MRRSWLPIHIGYDAMPAYASAASVRWMDFGADPLDAPFLRDTIAKLQTGTPPAPEIETGIDALLRLGEERPPAPIAGFIFHISRCGSTAVANALRASPDARVLSEPTVVSSLLVPQAPGLDPYLERRWSRLRERLLRASMAAFSHHFSEQGEPLVIKFPSLCTLSIGMVRSVWPSVPCVIMVRDPVEVMVASLRGGGWMTLRKLPETASGIFGWSDPAGSMPDEEFAARAVGSYLTSAARDAGADERNLIVVDHEDITPARVRRIAEFLGLNIPADSEAFESAFRTYSKDPSKAHAYRDDRGRKQREATAAVREAAMRWAMPAYSELRGRAPW